jgi:benzoylformate decarboxylase
MRTVKDVTFDLLRQLGLTTIVGNPGSTEETFLKNFPADFRYVLALQEASVVGIADGLSQGLRKPVIVNIHTAAGLGNAMGGLLTAYQNKTPLIVTAGQQHREMVLLEPLLTNVDAVNLPRPWVKWAYEPARAQDVPAAFMRAYATALQPPAGPVFLSLPLDDWDKEMPEIDAFRTVASRVGPDPQRLAEFAGRINASVRPVVVFGSDIARSQAWDHGIAFAERLGVPVWTAPFAERTPFPETHRLHAGVLPPAIGPLGETLKGHDLVIVIGAPVFRYYPFVPGRYLPEGAKLLQVTDDPNMSSRRRLATASCPTPAVPRIYPADGQGSQGVPFGPAAGAAEAADTATTLSANAVMSLVRGLPGQFVVVGDRPPTGWDEGPFRIDRPDSFLFPPADSAGTCRRRSAGAGRATAAQPGGRCADGHGSFSIPSRASTRPSSRRRM